MKTDKYFLICLLAFILVTCKEDKDEPVLTNSYAGTLSLVFSRDFPDFSTRVTMPVNIDKSGPVTFGSGGSDSFSAEDTLYDGPDPVLKMKVEGTIELESAAGRVEVINGNEFAFIKVSSHIQGTMYLWIWDDDNLMWIEPPVGAHELPFDYTDSYSDREMQFSIPAAVMDDAKLITELPDLEGTTTYGYALTLTVSLIK